MKVQAALQVEMKSFFGFSSLTQSETRHLSPLAQKLARDFSTSIEPKAYGEGVKSITATLVLTDPEGMGRLHKTKRPRYLSGKRTIKAHGVVVSIEDALEFTLRPSYGALGGVRSESQLACIILPELQRVKLGLVQLSIPNFSLDAFLTDLAAFLGRACERGKSVH